VVVVVAVVMGTGTGMGWMVEDVDHRGRSEGLSLVSLPVSLKTTGGRSDLDLAARWLKKRKEERFKIGAAEGTCCCWAAYGEGRTEPAPGDGMVQLQPKSAPKPEPTSDKLEVERQRQTASQTASQTDSDEVIRIRPKFQRARLPLLGPVRSG
jgi:hypothetical protein